MRGFLRFLAKIAPAAAIFNLTLTIAVYIAGYIIVNAFLSKFNIMQPQVLHTSYISAGLLFLIINISSAIFIVPLVFSIRTLIDWGIQLYSRIQSWFMKGVYWCLVVISIFLMLACVVGVEYIGSLVLSILFIFASRLSATEVSKSITLNITIISSLLGVVYLFFFLFLNLILYKTTKPAASQPMIMEPAQPESVTQESASSQPTTFEPAQPESVTQETASSQPMTIEPAPSEFMTQKPASTSFFLSKNRFDDFVQALLISIIILSFAIVQFYTLLLFSEYIYSKLPGSIGGGLQQRVSLYFEPEYANKYKSFYSEYGFTFLSSNNSNSELIKSEDMELFWQVSTPLNTIPTVYVVRPVPELCENCPVTTIPVEDVFSVGYLSNDTSKPPK